jgi:hypothetical protein
VTFTPTAVGASYSGSSLTMIAASYSTNTFAVSGTGSGSILTMVSATSLTFTTMTQGSPAPVVTWSFRNDGNANMGALALGTLNSPFSVTANYCTGPIPPGNSCSISAQMSTASQGSFSQSGISVSGATQGNRSDLQLAGTVTSSNTSVSGSPTSLAFGTVGKTQLRDLTVTFTNNGANAATGLTFTYATTSGSPSIGGYGPGPGSSCTSGGSLAAGASCTWVVEYEASCAAGGRNGTLTLSGSNFNPVPIALTATTSSSGVCR